MATQKFTTGDEARYTAAFLKSIQEFTDPDGTHGWATVIGTEKFLPGRYLVALTWPNGITRRVLDANLQRKGAPLRVCDGAD